MRRLFIESPFFFFIFTTIERTYQDISAVSLLPPPSPPHTSPSNTRRAWLYLDSTESSPRRLSLRSLASLSRLATSPPLPKWDAVARFFLSTAAAAISESTLAVSCSRSSFPRRMLSSSSSISLLMFLFQVGIVSIRIGGGLPPEDDNI